MAAKNERYAEKQGTKSQQTAAPAANHNSALPKTIEGSDEAERIASLVMQSNVQYDQFPPPMRGRHSNRPNGRGRPSSFGTARSAHGQPSFQGSGHTNSAYPDRAPKPSSNYVCHRCNRPGHWIDQCPTNGDPAYDRIKVRAPTGIPRSMLRQVDAPESGTGLQDSSGHFVTLQPNEEEFARQTVGLRLSQAAASAVDCKPNVKIGKNAGHGKADHDRASVATSQNGNVGEETNSQSRASPQQKPNKHAHAGSQLIGNGNCEQNDERAQQDTAGSTIKANSVKVPSPKHPTSEDGMKQNEVNNLKVHGKKPSSLPLKSQIQPPSQPGIPHIIPVPPIPPGFPSLGIPPVPSGVPPFPPHLFMAMAMAKRQNGQASHPPPRMPPNMAIPFTSPPPSTSDVKGKHVVTDAQQAVSQKEKKTSQAKDSRGVDARVLHEDTIPETKFERTRHKWSPNGASDRGDSSSGGRDKTPPSSEKIDFAFRSKHDSSSSRARRLGKGTIRNPENASSYAHGDGIRTDGLSDSRNVMNMQRPYNRREVHRSPSPPSRVAHIGPDKRRGSPSRRERRTRADRGFTSLSPKRRAPEKGRDDHHSRHSGREARNITNSSYEHRESVPWNDGNSRRDFQERRRAQLPLLRGIHGVNGAMYPGTSDRRSRSPEGRTRLSPVRHPHGNSSRSWYGHGSPNARARRSHSSDRRLRSVTPPRSGRHNAGFREETHARLYRQSDHAEKDREFRRHDARIREDTNARHYHAVDTEGNDRDFDSARNDGHDRLHVNLVEKSRRKVVESEKDDPAVFENMRDVSQCAEEGGKKPRRIPTDGSSPENESVGRAYYVATTDDRRKREHSARPDSEYRVLKKQRRQRGGDRATSHHDEIRDRRISVHDRLGRPADSRRRREQRRSVHDRLG